jgi:hypothetical protein
MRDFFFPPLGMHCYQYSIFWIVHLLTPYLLQRMFIHNGIKIECLQTISWKVLNYVAIRSLMNKMVDGNPFSFSRWNNDCCIWRTNIMKCWSQSISCNHNCQCMWPLQTLNATFGFCICFYFVCFYLEFPSPIHLKLMPTYGYALNWKVFNPMIKLL